MPDIRTGLVPLLDDDGRLAAHHTPTVVEQRLATLEAAVAELTARIAALGVTEPENTAYLVPHDYWLTGPSPARSADSPASTRRLGSIVVRLRAE